MRLLPIQRPLTFQQPVFAVHLFMSRKRKVDAIGLQSFDQQPLDLCINLVCAHILAVPALLAIDAVIDGGLLMGRVSEDPCGVRISRRPRCLEASLRHAGALRAGQR
ncbi:hypothetical protein NX02_02575 [Sphingomonas sanxanigenens DSM 19645 = NX02]|uniref:Uncharacterized protein n=1 Tax=Sphingomonas sanxanigenens DSM 19645 = NX02 TaxID=1123269 RepID=W0A2V0_9SPHN|nr:hypothetical protein NX02_02575 [Sphingomonas sanxanigenens DSM 19645 = NX02]